MKNSIYLVSLALLASMGLQSCQNEDFAEVQSPEGKEAHFKIGVNFADVTRTSLSEVEGDLKCTWEEGDVIVVTDENGTSYGTLSIVDGVGATYAHFDGTLYNVPEGNNQYTFIYPGKIHKASEFGTGEKVKFDFSNQTGTVASLSDNDYLVGFSDVNVIDGYGTTDEMGLSRRHAFAHFELIFPDGVNRTEEVVTIAGEGVKNYQSLTKRGGSSIGVDGAISVTGNTGNDFYVTLVAGEMTPTFAVTINGKEYTGSISTKKIQPGNFYRLGDKKGIPVQMAIAAVEGPDHSKNPLLKWAESDLTSYVTGAASKSVFTNNPCVTGSYYQFGRNRGYKNLSEAQKSYAVESSATYPKTAWPGDGTTTSISRYNSSTDFTKYPDMFFIDNTRNGDYRTPQLGETWFERAKSNGYAYESPCPEGWTIPSKKDYYEILPETANGGHGHIGFDIWENDGLSQLKTLEDGTKCVFRWQGVEDTDYKCYLMRIQCKVVADDVTSIPTDEDFWNSDVVTRDFKAAGYFVANIFKTNAGFWIARPLYWGNYDILNSNSNQIPPTYKLTSSLMKYGGFYWTSDAQQQPLNFVMDTNYAVSLDDGVYFAGFTTSSACNIRCIKVSGNSNQ